MRCVLKKFLAGTCVLAFALVALGSAKAQDFKGFYVGANAGEAFGRASMQTSPIFSPTGYFAATSTPAITAASTQQATPNGLTAGGGAGYSYQWDNFVLGFEVDFGKMDLSGATTVTQTYPCCAPTAFTVLQTTETSWLFTARPRMGVAFGHFLAYGTGGLAVTSVKYNALFTDTFATAHESASLEEKRPGWAVGGGGEFKFSSHWSIKGEYLYMGFGRATVTSTNLTAFTPPIPFPTNVFTHTVDLKAQIARAGVNFRF
jgi:outer membrane immunogenic protein